MLAPPGPPLHNPKGSFRHLHRLYSIK
uniref:Uncharacterized protein n=1 Tax=Heterorhabditis bacteriophora TaxID=37862 RepID=A0A1I7X7Y1_HETBA